MTPGATFSMTSVSLALTGPLPSIGWPSALTTRPISSGPDRHFEDAARALDGVALGDVLIVAENHGTDRIAFEVERQAERVARELEHLALHCVATSRGSRLMPSDSEITVPCVRTSAPVSRFWILPLDQLADFRWIQLHVFSSRSSRTSHRGRHRVSFEIRLDAQLVRHCLQFALHRSVDHRVADDDLRSADQRAVDADRRLDLLAEASLAVPCAAPPAGHRRSGRR